MDVKQSTNHPTNAGLKFSSNDVRLYNCNVIYFCDYNVTERSGPSGICYFQVAVSLRRSEFSLFLSFRKEVMISKPSPSGSLTHADFCTV